MIKPLTLIIGMCFSAVSTAHTTLIHNVNGYTPTLDGKIERFSTLVFKDGKVVKYGDKDTIKQFPQAKAIDGEGKTLLPGLIDAHGHIIGLGNNLQRLDLRGIPSAEAAGKKLQTYAKSNPDKWLVGRGWDQTLWDNKTFPTAADLDKYVSDRPVVLTRVDGHAIWVNSKAMQLAGISQATQSPEGGEIIQVAGKPSGIFIDKAESLVLKHIPKQSIEQKQRALFAASKHLVSLGITSAHDAGIDFDTWRLYQDLAEQNKLPFRIYAMLSASSPKLDDMLDAGVIKKQNDFLSIRSVKIYADGALGSRGAALIKDYRDRKNHKGLMLENKPELEALMSKTFKHGYSAHTHAIGDRANRIVLDSYESQFKTVGGKLLRNRIEHAQIVHPDDIPRFKQLDIIPSMQPVHATSDMHMAEKRLNSEQLQGAYAWQTFLKQGSKVASGSDFPVELANPFDGLYSAVTRMSKQQTPENGWRNVEKLSREQALTSFTLDAAYAAFQEYKLGSLEKGKWADFILIDRDYFTVPENEIFKIGVEQTWIAGEKRFEKK